MELRERDNRPGEADDPMRCLTIVRHAKAVPVRDEAADFDRPLSPQGVAQALEMGQRFAARSPKPDVILSSPATRAVETARLFAQAWDVETPEVALDPRFYLAQPDAILEAIRNTSRERTHVMIVGHNPGLSEFARRISRQPTLGELATAAVLHLEFDLPDWKALAFEAVVPTVMDLPGAPD